MLPRFCLYGFLKNQRFFEPFLLLALLDKGLSFFAVGLLVGFREIALAVMEIPTGAVADALGRRWAMILSHVGYVASFLTFYFAGSLPVLFLAMFAFSIGEAFRTGTHKAIIFGWLQHEGREEEKTLVYGFTRSWSKIGSAVNALIAAGLLIWLEDYDVVFLASAVPAALNVVNFLTYPRYLDFDPTSEAERPGVLRMLLAGLRQCWTRRTLRGLLVEAAAFDGFYKVAKDYLQPLLRQTALALPLLLTWPDVGRTALLVGIVYAALELLSSAASRKAEAWRVFSGGEEPAAKRLWWLFGGAFACLFLTPLGWDAVSIAGFVLAAIFYNLWRPIMVSRVASHVEGASMATVLSVESQSKTLLAAVLAPLVGLAVDAVGPEYRLIPIAAAGVLLGVAMGLRRRS